MLKKERVQASLMRKPADKIPVFMSATPQFLQAALGLGKHKPTTKDAWRYCVKLDLDVVQVGHPSFYPVRVLDFQMGEKYVDAFHRTHVITGYYDEFCAPFPLRQNPKGLDLHEIRRRWDDYTFPDPEAHEFVGGIETVVAENENLNDPLHVWGVINGPFEPAWQLISDAWTDFFILARRDRDLAKDIIERVTDYCIAAGAALIERGANAVRIGDDYGLNEGLMCAPKTWRDLIFPSHVRLVKGLKKAGGQDLPVILHSDGNIMAIIDWLAEGGIDALNPIQPDALDFGTVVEKVGNHLSMAGAFDLRYFLAPCTEQNRNAMERETRRLFTIIDTFNNPSIRTGFCIGPTHQVQPASYPSTFEAWIKMVHAINQTRAGKV
ncbi:MAG: uroporphyrinogen decarboxylase family protein [Candidatus Sigynarchaeota archaeon]